MKRPLNPVNVKGYTTPQPFAGFQIPITLQSLAIRRYCEDRGMVFNHHLSENIGPDGYLVLQKLVDEALSYRAIAMCSFGMLPKNLSRRTELLRAALTRGCSFHFVFEQVTIDSYDDLNQLNELRSLCNLIPSDDRQVVYLRTMLKFQ